MQSATLYRLWDTRVDVFSGFFLPNNMSLYVKDAGDHKKFVILRYTHDFQVASSLLLQGKLSTDGSTYDVYEYETVSVPKNEDGDSPVPWQYESDHDDYELIDFIKYLYANMGDANGGEVSMLRYVYKRMEQAAVYTAFKHPTKMLPYTKKVSIKLSGDDAIVVVGETQTVLQMW